MRFTVPLMLLTLMAPAAAAQADALPGDYLMVINAATDQLVVTINGKKLVYEGDPENNPPQQRIDVEPYLKPGENKVTVRYGKLGRALGDVRLSYARVPGRYRTMFRFQWQKFFPPKNNQTFTFVAEGPQGSGRISTGSTGDQTVLRFSPERTTLRLWVNGRYLGEHASHGLRDVSSYVKPGPNKVRVAWDGKPNFAVSLGYAGDKDKFKHFWDFRRHNIGPAKGDKTFTVTVPAPKTASR